MVRNLQFGAGIRRNLKLILLRKRYEEMVIKPELSRIQMCIGQRKSVHTRGRFTFIENLEQDHLNWEVSDVNDPTRAPA